MGKLGDFIPKREAGDVFTVEDYQDIPLTLLGVAFAQGEYGEIAFIDAITPAGTKVKIMAGAMLIVPALHAAQDAKAFPLECTFHKKGRAWIAL